MESRTTSLEGVDAALDHRKQKDEACTGINVVDLTSKATYQRTIAGMRVETGKDNPYPDNALNYTQKEEKRGSGIATTSENFLRF